MLLAATALPHLPWKKNTAESLTNSLLAINKEDSIELVNLHADDLHRVTMLQDGSSIVSKSGVLTSAKIVYAFSDEQVEVDFFKGGEVGLDDSFDTNRMNALDSVASELDFNNENASIGNESPEEEATAAGECGKSVD